MFSKRLSSSPPVVTVTDVNLYQLYDLLSHRREQCDDFVLHHPDGTPGWQICANSARADAFAEAADLVLAEICGGPGKQITRRGAGGQEVEAMDRHGRREGPKGKDSGREADPAEPGSALRPAQPSHGPGSQPGCGDSIADRLARAQGYGHARNSLDQAENQAAGKSRIDLMAQQRFVEGLKRNVQARNLIGEDGSFGAGKTFSPLYLPPRSWLASLADFLLPSIGQILHLAACASLMVLAAFAIYAVNSFMER